MGYCKKRGRNRFLVLLIAVFGFLYWCHLINISYFESYVPSLNYFGNESDASLQKLLVNTPSCHIPNISAWHYSIQHLLPHDNFSANTTEGCHKSMWSYVLPLERKLVLNTTAILSSGYSPTSVKCCYKSFMRGKDSDDLVTLTKECKPIRFKLRASDDRDSDFDEYSVTIAENEEFLRVLCTSKYWPLTLDVVYRAFHAVPIIKEDTLSFLKKRLIKYRRTKNPGTRYENSKPPNVLLLGIDSMSRLSFIRNMPQTFTYLRDHLKAVEILAYTKVGENTFPNALAFMIGKNQRELEVIGGPCNLTGSPSFETNFMDQCPFTWNLYRDRGYLTGFLEDAPYLATYNYGKFGFKERPVDFYLRPFMLGVNQLQKRKAYYYLDCLDGRTMDEMVLDYTKTALDMAEKNGLPIFLYAWLTNLAHGDLNKARAGDHVYKRFLEELKLEEKNTIMFFMSDHGYRYGPIRQTLSGWYEDKLPNMWVYLPRDVQENNPSWVENLKKNAGIVTSPFDLYGAFQNILGEPANSSFFSELDESRTCDDAGIPENFCACSVPKKAEDLKDPRIWSAANAAVRFLNENVIDPKRCAELSLKRAHAGAFQGSDKVIVGFQTSPGDFLFEGVVKNGKVIGELLRMSKIKGSEAQCAAGTELEKFCFCKS